MNQNKDMFGNMFEERKHVSYELAAKNQRKFEALNKILKEEYERKEKIKNYAEFENGVNAYDHKQKLNEQLKENRLKDNLRTNKNFLEEQIKLKRLQDKFEKDMDLSEAKKMNMKAQEELDKEAIRLEKDRLKRLKHKDELKNQMNLKGSANLHMTEQERLINKNLLGDDI